MKNEILLSKNILSTSSLSDNKQDIPLNKIYVSTILSNMAYYGFIPSLEILKRMNSSTDEELLNFWKDTEELFKLYFKDVLDSKEGVVYKNFPQEVLEMSNADYWIKQVFMYLGIKKDFFVSEEKEREKDEFSISKLRVLSPEKEDSLLKIFLSFKNKKVSMLETEKKWIDYLLNYLSIKEVNISDYSFKLNGSYIASIAFKNEIKVTAKNYTDILRFASFIYYPSINLNNRIYFFKFSRKERKLILKMMLTVSFYEEDISSRKETFKALFKALRPGDFAWAKPISNIYNELYNKKLKSFNSKINLFKENKDKELFSLLESRPGVFLKKFHEMYALDKNSTLEYFEKILPELTVYQILKFKKYIETINEREFIIARAKSSFEKCKILKNNKIKINEKDKQLIIDLLSKVLTIKTNKLFPNGVNPDEEIGKVYIPSNDQELNIGRGTVINIPDNITVLRTASYWISHLNGNIWFDNSWNFIHEDAEEDNACCWECDVSNDGMAIFSGDPTSSNSLDGKATQIIDINLEKLEEEGFNYAIWGLLSYNNIPFSSAEKVFASMQFLTDQNKGELFEPSKVELQLEVKGNNLNKAIYLLDVKNRKLICLDMPLPYLNTHSALKNIKRIRNFINPLNEYLNTLPTISDLLEFTKKEEKGVPFLYTDKNKDINGEAFVFIKENDKSNIEDLDLFCYLNK